MKQAQELTAELRAKYGPPTASADTAAIEKAYADRSAFLDASFKKILTPAHPKRFHEIMMQARDIRLAPKGAGTVIASAVAYPGAAEAVGLTADQRKTLLGGTAADDVLTDAQKATLKKLLGEPFAGARAGSFGAPPPWAQPGVGGRPIAALSATATVLRSDGPCQAALGLKPEQEKALAQARAALDTVLGTNVGPLGFGYRPAGEAVEAAAALAAFEMVVNDTLTAEQKKPLIGMARQVAAASNPAFTLTGAGKN